MRVKSLVKIHSLTVKADGAMSYRSIAKGVKVKLTGNISIVVLFCLFDDAANNRKAL
jgi:hypothetical protein